jgi:hypothetical protein
MCLKLSGKGFISKNIQLIKYSTNVQKLFEYPNKFVSRNLNIQYSVDNIQIFKYIQIFFTHWFRSTVHLYCIEPQPGLASVDQIYSRSLQFNTDMRKGMAVQILNAKETWLPKFLNFSHVWFNSHEENCVFSK